MTGLFAADPHGRIDNRDRAAMIKRRVSVVDVAQRHDAQLAPLTRGYEADCPHCRTGRVKISAGADHYQCGSCSGAGDAITFERAVTGAGFAAACDALDAAYPGQSATPDLFGSRSAKAKS